MEANGHTGRLGSRLSGQGVGGRQGSILIALLAALLAAGLIYVFVSHYHKTTVLPPATATVFVAKQAIPAGMSEQQIASAGLLEPKQLPLSQILVGAISDPSVVAGENTTAAIAVGQQLTATDFVRGSTSLATLLRGDQRAVAISIDPAHGMTGYVVEGNNVDVMVQEPSGASGVLFQNIEVLANQGGDVVLKLADHQVLQLADALQDKFTIWLAMRPARNASNSVRVGTVVRLG